MSHPGAVPHDPATLRAGKVRPPVPAETAGNRYEHIDGMRAFAVLLVIVGHAGLGHIVPGGAGVTVFFTISGFIITTLLLKEWQRTRSFDIKAFYVRRAVKLVPPLLLAVAVPTLIYAAFGGTISLNAFAGQLLFYFNLLDADKSGVLPGSGVVWSLSIEEQFYIVFAILWLWMVKSPRAIPWLTASAIGVVGASTAARVLLVDPGNQQIADRIYYGSDTRADSLAWGILVAILLFGWQFGGGKPGRLQRSSGRATALAAAVMVFLVSLAIRDDWYRQTIRYSLQSIATCVVLLYGFTAPDGRARDLFTAFCRNRVVKMIGLASYSVYLVHLSLIMWAQNYTDDHPLIVRVLIHSTLGVGVGVLMYRWIEIPARRAYEAVRDRRAEREVQQRA
ncbi:acyltransferase [Rhodococcus ruber]|uniref:acyltransferase family protein n=1 Tax=Rhodococcus TaxID=1827 RepID=UPI0009FC5E2C|nr:MULTISPECIES: acyltransferase [Rhodococcus]ATQ29095.1 acyltransferase [Rhodococcus ruber]